MSRGIGQSLSLLDVGGNFPGFPRHQNKVGNPKPLRDREIIPTHVKIARGAGIAFERHPPLSMEEGQLDGRV